MRPLWAGALVVLVVVLLASRVELGNRPASLPRVAVTALDGSRIHVDALSGKTVLVVFWATSCPVCVADMPRLANLHRELHPLGLETIAVAMPYDRPDQVLAMTRAQGYPFVVALDPLGEVNRAFGDIEATPAWFLFDTHGRISVRRLGPVDLPLVRDRVRSARPVSPASTQITSG